MHVDEHSLPDVIASARISEWTNLLEDNPEKSPAAEWTLRLPESQPKTAVRHQNVRPIPDVR